MGVLQIIYEFMIIVKQDCHGTGKTGNLDAHFS